MGRTALSQVAHVRHGRYQLRQSCADIDLSRLFATSLALLALSLPAAAEPVIGVIGPLSGPQSILGQQIVTGAFAASRGKAQLVTADDQCSATGGVDAARRVIAAQAVSVVGFLCTESLEAALPLFKAARIPVISIGVRTSMLTDRHDKTGFPLLRLSPRADGEQQAVARLLVPQWREANFAIVDDGTIGGREFAEAFRAAAEQAGLKPVFVDTYRPDMDNQVALIGRLRRAGATHVLVGGNRHDLAVIARDAKERDYELTLVGGESLRSDANDIELAPDTLMIGLPEWGEVASPDVATFLSERKIVAEGYTLPAYAAVQVALSAPAPMPEGDAVAAFSDRDIPTVLGPLRFDAKGDLTASLYRLYRWDGSKFVELESN